MFTALAQLLAPPTCAGCGAPGVPWCPSCDGVVGHQQWRNIGIRVCTFHEFSGPVRRSIIDWKDENRREARMRVIAWFAQGLAPLLEADPDAVVVPVPASPQSERRRGAGVLIEALRLALPDSRVEPWLVSGRSRRDQAGLDRGARSANMLDSMRWVGPVGRPVIVADDVITTGATLRECARAMHAAGATSPTGFALAYRERSDPVAWPVPGLRLHQDDDLGGFRGYQQSRTATGSDRARPSPRSR